MTEKPVMTLSETLAEYVYNLKFSTGDQDIIKTVGTRIIDYIAVSTAAKYYSDIPKKLIKFADALAGGCNTSYGDRCHPENIIGFLNGACAHCLDYDDGHLWAGIHAAGPVIGTAFALASKHKPNGRLFLEAITAGYEVDYRLGKALGKSHIQKGFHGSSTCGVIGAAVTAGKLVGLTQKQLTYAIGLAGLAASGYRQPLAEGQMAKPVQVGYAAEKGITAALLARQGIEAPLKIFEGDKGLFQIMSDMPKEKIVEDCLAALGTQYLINDTYTKLFPCCRYTHAAIEGALKLRNSLSNLEEITEIIVNTFDIAVVATDPNKEPASPPEARFSMNYIMAVALHTGFVGVDDFTAEAIARRDICATGKKVTTYSTKFWNDVYPKVRGAEIIIKTKGGETFSQIIDKLSGMSGDHEEVERKFFNSCKKIFSEKQQNKIVECISQIAYSADVSELIELCRTSRELKKQCPHHA